MPASYILALTAAVAGGTFAAFVVVAAFREQARYVAARRLLLPGLVDVQDSVRGLLSLEHEAAASAAGRCELRRACKALTVAAGRLTRSPAFETLRSREAGEVLERLELALDDLSASAWIRLSPSGPGADPGTLSRAAAATLRLCDQVERRLRTGLPDGPVETRVAAAHRLSASRFALAAMRLSSGRPQTSKPIAADSRARDIERPPSGPLRPPASRASKVGTRP